MRIRSLGDFQRQNRRLVVVLESSEQLPSISGLVDDADFCFDAKELASIRADRLVLLHCSPEVTAQALDEWKRNGNTCVEYWAPRDHFPQLIAVLREVSGWSLAGCKSNERLLQLSLLPEEASDHSASDFLQGLMVHRTFDDGYAVTAPDWSQPSLGSLLISAVVPYAKPLKRFIPPRVVVMMYKLLEKIR